MSTTTGEVFLIHKDISTKRGSPFLNKFGETFGKSNKKWDNYYLDERGGKALYEELRRIFLNGKVGNEVINDRSNKERVFRPMAL